MQIQRMFEIVYILLQKRRVTAKELAEHFEVSTRTIYRDLDALSMAGIPLYTNKAVSYTHLDVYKRQALNTSVCFIFCIPRCMEADTDAWSYGCWERIPFIFSVFSTRCLAQISLNPFAMDGRMTIFPFSLYCLWQPS